MKIIQYQLLRSLILVSFFQFSCPPETETEVQLTSESYTYEFNEEELELLSKINTHRAEMNLNALTINTFIANVGLDHNLFMMEHNVVSQHNFHQRSQFIKNTLEVTNVAEIIAYNYASVNVAIKAWLQSDSHKENLEGDFFLSVFPFVNIRKIKISFLHVY
jgi:uncharacterized protein YkwD